MKDKSPVSVGAFLMYALANLNKQPAFVIIFFTRRIKERTG